MKKKILIVFTGAMELGGIERSLLGLLDAINYEQYEVDLFLYAHHGPLFPLINKNVNILPEVKELAYLRESFVTKLRHGCFYSAFLRIQQEFLKRVGKGSNDSTWLKVIRKFSSKQEKHYDIALSFFRSFDYIVEKVDAEIKVGWVHTDYTQVGEPIKPLEDDYSRMDYIAAVSDGCAESFEKLFPRLANKIITVENILSREFVLKQSVKIDVSEEMPIDGSLKLLSVGRFCDAKNFDNIPIICKKIREQGVPVKWYLIGFGVDEKLIRQRIIEAGMQENVIILGKKDNPYPYIKSCDVYVQPSRYEGKCVSVREAQLLGKPVVITRYATCSSQLDEDVDGVIVPMDNAGCAAGIVELLQNPEKMNHLSEVCNQRDYTNSMEVEKLYRLIR